jgi:hypothetical protein
VSRRGSPPSIAPAPGEIWHNPKRNRIARVETVTSSYVEYRYVDSASGARFNTATIEDFLLSFRAPSGAA